ncbi:MAG: hypothetical protein J6D15_02805 [Clostridia bacterium]|nr:hypothetical protein [Clostridia bacterium]
MAVRKCFVAKTDDSFFQEINVEFEYHKGFALSQKQKSIQSLHENILKIDNNYKALEVSTKSPVDIGKKLSAFNLSYLCKNTNKKYLIENVFQSSKVFENGGPFLDLLNVHPREAKADIRLKNSGKLIHFECEGQKWPLIPKTMFYDWLYINALYGEKYLAKRILSYDVFTDIEFNHKKSINCQARAAAIFVSLSKKGVIEDYIKDKELFKNIYQNKECYEQLSLWS